MRPQHFAILLAFYLTYLPLQVHASEQEQVAAISGLGVLNGIALHCRYVAETRRMKRSLVVALPKRRQLGRIFEEQTNESFLAFISDNASCPAEAELASRVDAAIEALDEVFDE